MEDQNTQHEETPQEAITPILDEHKVAEYTERLKLEQNLPLAIAFGFGAALLSAVLWAGITVATKFQIGYMAIAVGLIVGFAVRYGGKGIDKVYGFIGAFFALIGCVIGNYLSMIGLVANEESISFFELFTQVPITAIPSLLIEGFQPMDVLFYGLALYQGYSFSFRNITEEEILENISQN